MEDISLSDILSILKAQKDVLLMQQSEITALRSLVRAMALQPCFKRELLHLSATALLDANLSRMPPEQQNTDILLDAQRFLDALLKSPSDADSSSAHSSS